MKQKGFTLLEILLVIAAIGILAAIVIVAINPNRQLAQARDAQRQSDVNTIYKALEQYLIDEGSYPSAISSGDILEICDTGSNAVGEGSVNPGCADLRVLVPTYLASIPSDPSSTTETGFVVTQDTANLKASLVSMYAEQGENININYVGIVSQISPDPSYDSCLTILNSGDANGDGMYTINITGLGYTSVYCIMDTNVNGGGWTGLTPEISPQNSSTLTTSTWVENDGRLREGNPHILDVLVGEVECGVTSNYQLQNPSVVGLNYSESMMLMQRISTIGQCSRIPNGSFSGWFSGSQYSGVSTENGMCLWGDGIFAYEWPDTQNMSGLQTHWVIRSSVTSNPNIEYSVQCGAWGVLQGQHYHMWFVR